MSFEEKFEIIRLSSSVGKCYFGKQLYEEALDNFMEGLALLNTCFSSVKNLEDLDNQQKDLFKNMLFDLLININKSIGKYSQSLIDKKETLKAIKILKKIISFYEFELNPHLYEVVKSLSSTLHYCLGLCLQDIECYEDAVFFLKKFLEENENNQKINDAYRIIADILALKLNKKEESIFYYEKYLEKDANPSVYNMLGYLYENTQKYQSVDKQLYYFEKAVECDPDYRKAHKNLTVVYINKKDWTKASAHFDELRRLGFSEDDKYDYGSFNVNLKNFDEGWKYMEARFTKNLLPVKDKNPGKPEWKGDIIKNSTLLVDYEQGFGDTFQFIRYVPMLSKYTSKVILRVQQEITHLVAPSIEQLCQDQGLSIDIIGGNIKLESLEFDYYIPLMSLLNLLKVTDKNVPYVSGYLKVDDKDKVKYFKEKYFNHNKLKIGINWKTFTNMSQRVARCLKLEQFEILGKLDPEKVEIYSIQFGDQEEAANSKFPIVDLTSEIKSFEDSAAIIKNLDMVISIDSGPVHLTGAIGKPIWVLLPYNSCWRWFEDDTTSIWYDKAVLFRQDKTRDWNQVITNIYESILKLI